MFKQLNTAGVSATEWLLWRNGFNMLIWLLINSKRRLNPFSPKDQNGQIRLILFRVFVGQLGFCCFYFAATLIPLFLLTIILQTAPLWTSFLGKWVNDERVYCFEYAAMLLCFIGVVAVTASKHSNSLNFGESNSAFIFGCLIVFVNSWCLATINVCNRKLKEVDVTIIVFWHLLIGLTLGSLYYLYINLAEGYVFELHSASVYGWLIFMCVLDFTAMNCLTRAFQLDSSAFLSIISYCIVLYGFAVDVLYWKLPIGGSDLVGACLIFLVTITTVIYKYRLQSKGDFIKQI